MHVWAYHLYCVHQWLCSVTGCCQNLLTRINTSRNSKYNCKFLQTCRANGSCMCRFHSMLNSIDRTIAPVPRVLPNVYRHTYIHARNHWHARIWVCVTTRVCCHTYNHYVLTSPPSQIVCIRMRSCMCVGERNCVCMSSDASPNISKMQCRL